jgi:ParB/RepB/Spo0J family partition protein
MEAKIETLELAKVGPGPNPRQPRIEREELTSDLEQSMKTIEEQRIPIVVTKRGDSRYEIIDGHRRFHVASKLGWSEIKAIVLPTSSEMDVIKEMGIINMHMTELTPLEKGIIINAYFESLMKQEKLDPKLSDDRKKARGKMLDYLSKTVFHFSAATLSHWLTLYENFTKEDMLNVNSYEAAMVLQAAKRLKVKPSIVIKEAKAAGLGGKGYWSLPKVAKDTQDLKEAVAKAKELEEESTSSYISYPRSLHKKVRFLARTLKVDTQAMLVDLIEIGSVAALDVLFSVKNPTRAKFYEAWDRYLSEEVRPRARKFEPPVTGPTVIEDPSLYAELKNRFVSEQRAKQEALK